MLTTYINFGALTMNYLELSMTLARFLDPTNVDKYDASVFAIGIGIVMQMLTFGLFACFGGYAAAKGFAKARNLDLRVKVQQFRDSERFSSLRWPSRKQETPNSNSLSTAVSFDNPMNAGGIEMPSLPDGGRDRGSSPL